MRSNVSQAAIVIMLVAIAGCATQSASPDAELDKAVASMTNGYTELGKVANNLDQDQISSAKRHFNKAMKDFDQAIEYFAEAALPAEDKPAIAELKQGFGALEKSVKALERNDVGEAQTYYDQAQTHFANSAVLLD
jgi:cytochrome c556